MLMENINIESLIKEKRVFTSGSGKEFNYSFVPALVNKMYQLYIQSSSDINADLLQQQKDLKDKKLIKKMYEDDEFKKEFNDKAKSVYERAEAVNKMGMDIILLVLNKNPQDFEVSEDAVLADMSNDDMAELIKFCCVASPEQKKSNKKLSINGK